MSQPNITPETIIRRPGMEYPAEGSAVNYTATKTPTETPTLETPSRPFSSFSYLGQKNPYVFNGTSRFGYFRTLPHSSSTMFDHPEFDPNAGRQEAYDKEYAKYMADLRTSGKKRVNLKRANQAFEQRFNESWQQGESERRNAYLTDRRQKLDEYWNDRRQKHEDAIAEAYRQEGYTFDEATGEWSRPLTHGLDFNNTTAVQEWLMNNGYNLDRYGADGKYGAETNNAISTMLNDGKLALSEDEKQQFMNLQTSYNNRHARQQPTQPTQPTQTSQVNPFVFKGANDYSTKAAFIDAFKRQYNDYLGGKHSVTTDAGVTLVGNSIEDDANYDKALDTALSNYQKNGWLIPSYTLKSKRGGTLIKKHQQGGNMGNDIQTQVKQLVQAVANGDQQAAEQVKQIMQAAEQGDQQALQIAQMIQAEIEAIKSAKRGAKLNYIKSLKGDCPDGEEVVYFKKGGEICKACQKKHDKMIAEKVNKLNPIEEFKKGRKTKKC